MNKEATSTTTTFFGNPKRTNSDPTTRVFFWNLQVLARTLCLALVFLSSLSIVQAADVEKLSFEQHIRPIFRAHCFDCHGATEKFKGDLDLRLVRFIKKGGKNGPAIVPGNPQGSYLLERIQNGEMPPGENSVPQEEIEIIKRWIAAGAVTARPEPASLAAASATYAGHFPWFFTFNYLDAKLPKYNDDVAKKLSRNAVIGKVHRLGLSGRAKSPSSAAPRPTPSATAATSATSSCSSKRGCTTWRRGTRST